MPEAKQKPEDVEDRSWVWDALYGWWPEYANPEEQAAINDNNNANFCANIWPWDYCPY